MRAPFPWFGGKSRAADIIWRAFGDVPNYVEPFAGSLAVLLARPHAPRTETVNDADCYLANFWRATAAVPDEVAHHADWPVNEADLHARHRWLVDQAAFRERMKSDPDYHDAKIAGWWVWGLCQWIGSGWCPERQRGDGHPQQLPHLGDAGMGIHRKLPHLGDAGRGIHRKLPHLGDAGRVWHPQQLPHLGNAGRGIHRKLPHLGDAVMASTITDTLRELSARLRGTRIACGDWSRVLGGSVTWRHGTTAVLLDPPYVDGEMDYAVGGTGTNLSAEVRAWAIEAGQRPDMRIALCGLEGEHEMPPEWRCVPWKARGGYGSTRRDGTNDNAHRERIWFSPACLDPTVQQSLFDGASC